MSSQVLHASSSSARTVMPNKILLTNIASTASAAAVTPLFIRASLEKRFVTP